MVFSFLNMSLESHVYWIEKDSDSKSENIILQSAPLNVNQILYSLLFSRDYPVVLTSATLAVNKKLDHFRNRTGYGNGAELILDSPFSPEQVTMYLPGKMPEPNAPEFPAAVTDQVINFTGKTNGKAFVLFTSYKMMSECAKSSADFFEDENIQLLVQGQMLSRSAMLEEFKNDTTSVLFGTSSFWTGVDVPGESLSNVIITRLPFAVPTHPLIKARCELIEQANRSSFMHYSLPEAILKLRQGIGRLIRSKNDNGIIVLLDRRIMTKNYGRTIINSLPPYPTEIF